LQVSNATGQSNSFNFFVNGGTEPSMPPTDQNGCYTLTANMSLGSTGSEVVGLQTVLLSHGFLNVPTGYVKGTFDEITKAAVIRFQNAYNMPATGFVGLLTLAKLNQVICPNPSTPIVITPATSTPPVIVTPYPTTNGDCGLSTPSVVTSDGPKLLNIDFGAYTFNGSTKTGPAVVGSSGDFWNAVQIPGCSLFNRNNLSSADHSISPVVVEIQNLTGAWSSAGNDGWPGLPRLGLADNMLYDYGYSMSSGSTASVILRNITAGDYNLYLYNKTPAADQNGDYTVTVGSRDYGRKTTSADTSSPTATQWQEGNQYVVFPITVNAGDAVSILIQPSLNSMQHAQISGLQLAPVGTPAVAPAAVSAPATVAPAIHQDGLPFTTPKVIKGQTSAVSDAFVGFLRVLFTN
jgi:hypothetical protein